MSALFGLLTRWRVAPAQAGRDLCAARWSAPWLVAVGWSDNFSLLTRVNQFVQDWEIASSLRRTKRRIPTS